MRNCILMRSVTLKFLNTAASAKNPRGPMKLFTFTLPKLPIPGSANGPPLFAVISGTGVKNARYGFPPDGCCSEPTPVCKDPLPWSGRHTPTSCSLPQLLKLGVQGNPPLQFQVPETCHPPMSRSSARPAFPAKLLPFPKGSSYDDSVTHTCRRTWLSGP